MFNLILLVLAGNKGIHKAWSTLNFDQIGPHGFPKWLFPFFPAAIDQILLNLHTTRNDTLYLISSNFCQIRILNMELFAIECMKNIQGNPSPQFCYLFSICYYSYMQVKRISKNV